MNRSQRATPISRRVRLSNAGDTSVRMFRSYRFRVVPEMRPSMSMSASQYATRSANRLSGVSVVSADCSSDRSTSRAFNARSAAAAVAPELCTWRVLPSQSRNRVRASKRPDGTFRVVMSPTVPMASSGLDIRSLPILCFALLGDPRPHVGDGALQMLAKPVRDRALAKHAPVVDGGDGQAEVGRQLADVHERFRAPGVGSG
jgi:hypothetical protein